MKTEMPCECGGTLRLLHGPVPFYGCTNWPKCEVIHAAASDGSIVILPQRKVHA